MQRLTEGQLWELIEEACRRRESDPLGAAVGVLNAAMTLNDAMDGESEGTPPEVFWVQWRMDLPPDWRRVDYGEGWEPATGYIEPGDQSYWCGDWYEMYSGRVGLQIVPENLPIRRRKEGCDA